MFDIMNLSATCGKMPENGRNFSSEAKWCQTRTHRIEFPTRFLPTARPQTSTNQNERVLTRIFRSRNTFSFVHYTAVHNTTTSTTAQRPVRYSNKRSEAAVESRKTRGFFLPSLLFVPDRKATCRAETQLDERS